jgi:polysaccharide export outer membrane protein
MKIPELLKFLLATTVLVAGAGHAADAATKAAPATATIARTASDADTSNYVVGPGDTIQVFVWRNPELSTTVPVRPDGKVSTPLVEDVVAVGKTPSQLARDIETRLSEYIRSPQVNVIVTAAQSAYSQITVIGRVKTPKTVPYREGMTLLDVILAVGGLDDFAAGNRAKLIRKTAEGKTTEHRLHLADLVKSGQLRDNMMLQPGDVLLVPESRF